MEMVACPLCGNSMVNAPELAGQVVKCPHCQQMITMPAAVAVQPPVQIVKQQGISRSKSLPKKTLKIPRVATAAFATVAIFGALAVSGSLFILPLGNTDHAQARRWLHEHSSRSWSESSWRYESEYRGKFTKGRPGKVYIMEFSSPVIFDDAVYHEMRFYFCEGEMVWPMEHFPEDSSPGVPPEFHDFMDRLANPKH